jgi:hypothetical protein
LKDTNEFQFGVQKIKKRKGYNVLTISFIFGQCGQENLYRKQNLVALPKERAGLTYLRKGQDKIPGPILEGRLHA